MDKKLQAKHLTDAAVLEVVDRVFEVHNRWTHVEDLEVLGPRKIVLAKCRSMLRRSVLRGCACGCRGNFQRPRFESPLLDLPTYHSNGAR